MSIFVYRCLISRVKESILNSSHRKNSYCTCGEMGPGRPRRAGGVAKSLFTGNACRSLPNGGDLVVMRSKLMHET